jgi:hypothetical protein
MLHRPPAKPKPVAARKAARAARDRRHRQRVREGLMTAVIEIGGAELDWLIRMRYLDPRDVDGRDPRQIRAAVGGAVSNLLRISART